MLRRLLALLAVVSPLALMPTTAAADDPMISMVACVRNGQAVSVPAGSPLTLRVGWAMATRGNLQSFVNASTATFTLNGTAVTPTTSDLVPITGVTDTGDGSDGWRVTWSFNTIAPAKGQTLVWTTTVSLSRPVTDHELGLGKPVTIPAGVLFGPPGFSCTITGS